MRTFKWFRTVLLPFVALFLLAACAGPLVYTDDVPGPVVYQDPYYEPAPVVFGTTIYGHVRMEPAYPTTVYRGPIIIHDDDDGWRRRDHGRDWDRDDRGDWCREHTGRCDRRRDHHGWDHQRDHVRQGSGRPKGVIRKSCNQYGCKRTISAR